MVFKLLHTWAGGLRIRADSAFQVFGGLLFNRAGRYAMLQNLQHSIGLEPVLQGLFPIAACQIAGGRVLARARAESLTPLAYLFLPALFLVFPEPLLVHVHFGRGTANGFFGVFDCNRIRVLPVTRFCRG